AVRIQARQRRGGVGSDALEDVREGRRLGARRGGAGGGGRRGGGAGARVRGGGLGVVLRGRGAGDRSAGGFGAVFRLHAHTTAQPGGGEQEDRQRESRAMHCLIFHGERLLIVKAEIPTKSIFLPLSLRVLGLGLAATP